MSASDFDPLDPETVECPYPFYAALREAEPAYQVPERGFFLVGRYDAAVRVLMDSEHFSSVSGVGVPRGHGGTHRPELPPRGAVHTLLTADPPVHAKYRALVNKTFSARRVAALEPRVRAIAEELVDSFIERGEVRLIYDFAVPLPLIVICEALGLPHGEQELRTFKRWSDGIAQLGGMATPEQLAEIREQQAVFNAYLLERVRERRSSPRDDIISDLVTAVFDGQRPLTDPEVMSILAQLLVAGNETTTNTIASGMLLLLQHPDQFDAVRADRSLVPNLVEEVLRYESPVQAHFRLCAKDTVLDGVAIPEGAGVGVVFGCANRDEAQFPRGDDFDVRRPNARTHLAFSQGIHYCVGAPLARLEAVVAFETLFDRLENVRLVPEKSDLRHVPSFTHRGMHEVALAFDPAPRR